MPAEPGVLRAVNPLTKLTVAMALMALATFLFDPTTQCMVASAPALALLALDRLSPLHLALVILPFALFGFGFLSTTVLFYEHGGYYAASLPGATGEPAAAWRAGWVLLLRSIAFGMVSYAFVRTTDPTEFMVALVQHARLPIAIGYALLAALQSLPRLRDDARQLRYARAIRERRRPARLPGVRELAWLATQLLVAAIRRADHAARSMEARGLGHDQRRRSFRRHVGFGRSDAGFVAVASLVIAAILLG